MKKFSSKALNVHSLVDLSASASTDNKEFRLLFHTAFGYIIGEPSDYKIPESFLDNNCTITEELIKDALSSDTMLNILSLNRLSYLKSNKDSNSVGDGSLMILKNVVIKSNLGEGAAPTLNLDSFALHMDSIIGMALIDKNQQI